MNNGIRQLATLAMVTLLFMSHGIAGDNHRTPVWGSYEELYDQLMNLKPDPEGVAVVENVTLMRDVATFHLFEGTLYRCMPVGGRACALIFMGKGSVSFKPPTLIEQRQLERFYESDSLEKEFSSLFIMFADSSLDELNRKLTFGHGKIDDAAERQVEYCLQYMGTSDGKNFNPELVTAFLNDDHNDLFYAHFSSDKREPMFFEINPYEFEEVRLMRRMYGASDVLYRREVVCQFHRQQEYASGIDLSDEGLPDVGIEHYDVEHTLKDVFDHGEGNTLTTFTFLRDGRRWLNFRVDGEIDSLLWPNGARATFFHDKKNPNLWVRCDTPSVAGRQTSLHSYGKHFYPIYGIYPKASLRKATFELDFRYPSRYQFVAVGNNTVTSTMEGMTTTQWVTPKPINIFGETYYLDESKVLDIRRDSIPPITVMMEEHRSGAIEDVGNDIATSIAFFHKIFGPCPVNRMYAAEIPGNMGLAFPGLILLSSATFRNESHALTPGEASPQEREEIFRAHEVAHQWWGLSVDFKTYHDQWLSEGFANYSGLWYMQSSLRDNEKFFATLRKWKRNILDNRKFTFGSGQEAGPIWLGYRTSSSATAHDYNLIIYQKGAWVLHMLRNMMLDLRTLNEDGFKNMMREFYLTYRGRAASTEDFRSITEKYLGYKMDWFFNQWVYGTSIPSYKFAYKAAPTTEGKYKVTCRVQQLNVPDDFLMFVPLFVDFGNKQFIRLQILVKGPLSEFDLPLLPLKPEKIIFNDLESVLCNVEYVDWK